LFIGKAIPRHAARREEKEREPEGKRIVGSATIAPMGKESPLVATYRRRKGEAPRCKITRVEGEKGIKPTGKKRGGEPSKFLGPGKEGAVYGRERKKKSGPPTVTT